MSIDSLQIKVGRLLEASPIKRAMVIPYFLLPVFCQYLLFHLVFILYPVSYIHSQVLINSIPLDVLFLAIVVGLMLARDKLEFSGSAQRIIPCLFSGFFVISLMTLGYLVGHMSIVAGAVIAAAPLLAIILFDKHVVISMILLGIFVFSCICVLDTLEIIPYAPLFTSDVLFTGKGRLFYLACMLYFMAPHILAIFTTTYLLVDYWRSREEDIRRMSVTDSLLGMSNRRAISNHLEMVMEEQGETHEPLSIILVDIDHFKHVNDTYGHLMGDKVLCEVGDYLQDGLRGTDQVGRYGGEEFLIVLKNTDLETAITIAERCREKIESATIWSDKKERIPVTASFGVYCAINSNESLVDMMQKVDVQLYRAKEFGRNLVCSPNSKTDAMMAIFQKQLLL